MRACGTTKEREVLTADTQRSRDQHISQSHGSSMLGLSVQ